MKAQQETNHSAEAVSEVLDDFHDAAAQADGVRYFNHFAGEAVFLGTDATERWTFEEFKAYAQRRFEQGSGWTYKVESRHIFFSSDKSTAWFDEMLTNESLGECRGSGVLVMVDGVWKIAQYHLTIPIPNQLARQVVEMIRADSMNITISA